MQLVWLVGCQTTEHRRHIPSLVVCSSSGNRPADLHKPPKQCEMSIPSIVYLTVTGVCVCAQPQFIEHDCVVQGLVHQVFLDGLEMLLLLGQGLSRQI